MTALSTDPVYPIPGRSTKLVFALAGGAANYVRVWCTIAPTGSSLDNSLSDAKSFNRFKVYEGPGGTNDAHVLTFDKGGKYTFVAQEYTRGTPYGGAYDGDPNRAMSEEKVGAETTLTLYVSQKLTQVIGPQGDQATLVLWVNNATIVATTKAQHGEDTPVISITGAPTEKVKTAIASVAVDAALAALAGETVVDAAGNIAELVADYWLAFNRHVNQPSIHSNSGDQVNEFTPSFETASGPSDFIEFVNSGLLRLRRHLTNDTGFPDDVGYSGPDTGDWHIPDTTNISDRANLPVYKSVGSFAEAYGAFADLHRCLSGHKSNETPHVAIFFVGVEDYELLPLPLIMQVHSAFLTVLATTTPVVPPAQSTGAQLLISGAGFKES